MLDNVTESKTSAEFPNPPTLHEFMTTDLQHYYTYNGSLTTPPCSEVVVWLDFKQPIPLSHRQVCAVYNLIIFLFVCSKFLNYIYLIVFFPHLCIKN